MQIRANKILTDLQNAGFHHRPRPHTSKACKHHTCTTCSNGNNGNSGDEIGYENYFDQLQRAEESYTCGPLYTIANLPGGPTMDQKNLGPMEHRATLAYVDFDAKWHKMDVDYNSVAPLISYTKSAETFINNAGRLNCAGYQLTYHGNVRKDVNMHGKMYGNLKGVCAGLPKTSQGVTEMGGGVHATITETFLQPWKNGDGESLSRANNGNVREASYSETIASARFASKGARPLNTRNLVDLHVVVYTAMRHVAMSSVSTVETEMTAKDIYSLPGSTLSKCSFGNDVVYVEFCVREGATASNPTFHIRIAVVIPRTGEQAAMYVVSTDCTNYNKFLAVMDVLYDNVEKIFNYMLTGNTSRLGQLRGGSVWIEPCSGPIDLPTCKNLEVQLVKDIVASGTVNIV